MTKTDKKGNLIKGPSHNAATYTMQQRAEALYAREQGETFEAIAELIGCAITTIFTWMRQHQSGDVPIDSPRSQTLHYEP